MDVSDTSSTLTSPNPDECDEHNILESYVGTSMSRAYWRTHGSAVCEEDLERIALSCLKSALDILCDKE